MDRSPFQSAVLHKAVQHMYAHRSEGDLLMDAPRTSSWLELKQWVKDRKKWRMRAQAIRAGTRVTIKKAVFVPEMEFPFSISS